MMCEFEGPLEKEIGVQDEALAECHPVRTLIGEPSRPYIAAPRVSYPVRMSGTERSGRIRFCPEKPLDKREDNFRRKLFPW